MLQNQSIDLNAINFALLLTISSMSRPIWHFNSSFSTVQLGVFVIYSFVILFYSVFKYNHEGFGKSLICVVFVMFTFCVQLLYNPINDFTLTRIYEFFSYCVPAVIVFSCIRDYSLVLKVLYFVGYWLFLSMGFDPLFQYFFTKGYMVYGYQVMLPSFVFIYSYCVYQNRLSVIDRISLVLILLLIMIGGNRGAFVASVIFYINVNLFFTKEYRKIFLIFTSFLIGVAVLYNYFDVIIAYLDDFFVENNINSYSFAKIKSFLDSETKDDFLSGRGLLWFNAKSMFYLKPLFGNGIASFDAKYLIYPHNCILELLVSYGLFFFMFYLFFISYSLVIVFRSKNSQKLIGIIFFSIAFPKLLSSVYIYMEPSFWLCCFFPFLKNRNIM